MSTSPNITWVFAVNSGLGLQDREERVSAPLDAPRFKLECDLHAAGYIRVNLLRKEWEKWAWPGGYPIYYVCKDGGLLCADCANENIALTTDLDAAPDWAVIIGSVNWEDPSMTCDNCYKEPTMDLTCSRCSAVVATTDGDGIPPRLLCATCAPMDAAERAAAESAELQATIRKLEQLAGLLGLPVDDLPTTSVERVAALRGRISL